VTEKTGNWGGEAKRFVSPKNRGKGRKGQEKIEGPGRKFERGSCGRLEEIKKISRQRGKQKKNNGRMGKCQTLYFNFAGLSRNQGGRKILRGGNTRTCVEKKFQ